MKKCYSRYCAGLLITGCAQQTFTVQNKPAAAPKETITIISSFLELGKKKTVDAAKICGGARKYVVKTETQQTFVNGLLGLCFRHLYSAGSAVLVLTNNCMSCHRYGQLYLHCSLIYFWV